MSATSTMAASAAPIARRFVWKEYRVLRGLWLAVAAMAVLVDWTTGTLMPPQYNFATLYFSVALAASVLYAVGVAATTFSLEHEEETRSFLNGLPTVWWPVFIGKLSVAAVSAGALAGVLTLVGWVSCGFNLPNSSDLLAALGLFGTAIVEALAWGTLFSLLTKRPLAAAIWTLVVGTTVTHLAVNYSGSNTSAGFLPAAYLDAVPLRCAIVAVVLVASATLAQRWLLVGRSDRPGWLAATWMPRRRRIAERFNRPFMGRGEG